MGLPDLPLEAHDRDNKVMVEGSKVLEVGPGFGHPGTVTKIAIVAGTFTCTEYVAIVSWPPDADEGTSGGELAYDPYDLIVVEEVTK